MIPSIILTLIGVAGMFLSLKVAFDEGKDGKLKSGGAFFILYFLITAIGPWYLVASSFLKGTPKSMTDTFGGAYITLSRVNNGESSYSMVKDAKGNIRLLQGKATMPNLKSFTIRKGEVVEFK